MKALISVFTNNILRHTTFSFLLFLVLKQGLHIIEVGDLKIRYTLKCYKIFSLIVISENMFWKQIKH